MLMPMVSSDKTTRDATNPVLNLNLNMASLKCFAKAYASSHARNRLFSARASINPAWTRTYDRHGPRTHLIREPS